MHPLSSVNRGNIRSNIKIDEVVQCPESKLRRVSKTLAEYRFLIIFTANIFI